MARETKFGFLFVIVLTGVFGMLVYKRMHEPLGLVAATAGEVNEVDSTPEGPPDGDAPPANDSTGNKASTDPGLLAPVVDLAPQRPASPSTSPSPASTPLVALPRESLTPPETPAAKSLTPAPTADDPFGETTVQSVPTKPKLPTSVDEDFFSSPTNSVPASTAQTTTPTNPVLTPAASLVTKTAESSAQDDPFGFSASETSTAAPKESATPVTPTTVASSAALSSPSAFTNGTTTTPASPTVASNAEEEEDPFDTPAPAMTPADSKTTTALEVPSNPAASGTAAKSTDSFDPFTGQPVAAATPVTEQKKMVTDEADPFESPIEMKSQGSATLPTELDDTFSEPNSTVRNVARTPAPAANSEANPFGETKELKEPVRSGGRAESAVSEMKAPSQADPFDSAPADPPTSEASKMTAAPALEFEADEFNAAPGSTTPPRSVTTATPPVAEPAFDPLDEPTPATPSTSASTQGAPRMTPLPTEADPFDTASTPVEQPASLPKPALPTGETRTAATALPTFDPEPQPVPRTNPIPAATGTTASLNGDFPPVTRSAPPAVLENTGSYVVQPGDNYWTISKQLYGSGRYFQALAKHNTSVAADPQKLKPGMQIATPASTELETRYRAEMPLTATSPAAISQPTNSGGRTPREGEGDPGFFLDPEGVPRYRIGAADTLSLIARNHLGRSSRWVQIYEMNRDILKDGNTLSVGTVLHLPPDASQVQSVMSSPASR